LEIGRITVNFINQIATNFGSFSGKAISNRKRGIIHDQFGFRLSENLLAIGSRENTTAKRFPVITRAQ